MFLTSLKYIVYFVLYVHPILMCKQFAMITDRIIYKTLHTINFSAPYFIIYFFFTKEWVSHVFVISVIQSFLTDVIDICFRQNQYVSTYTNEVFKRSNCSKFV